MSETGWFKHTAVASVAAVTLILAPAYARGPQSDTKGQMSTAEVDAFNRSLGSCGCAPDERPPTLAIGYEPYYPASLLRRGEGGRCTLSFTVDPTGQVRDIATVGEDSRLCAHARLALGYWKFQPATRGGAPVAYPLTVPFDYAIR